MRRELIADLHIHMLRSKESIPPKHQVEPYKAGFEILVHEISASGPIPTEASLRSGEIGPPDQWLVGKIRRSYPSDFIR